MGAFSKFGIKTNGKYLFYTVGKDSAVFLAVKKKKIQDMSTIVIPEKIGKYTVRGISTPHFRAKTIRKTELSWNESWKLSQCLRDYYRVDYFETCTLPETIEYIGVLPECKAHDRFVLPKNVSYVENSKISTKILVLPKDIKYIGKVTETKTLEEILTGNEQCDEGVPHYSLNQYRGEKDEDQFFHSKIIKNAFCNHFNLKNIILPDGIEEIEEMAFCGVNQIEQFHFPKSLKKISDKAFENAQFIGTYKYPSDFPVALQNDNYDFKITGKILLEDMSHFNAMLNSQNSNGERFTNFASELDLSYTVGKLPDRAFYKNDSFYLGQFQKISLGDNITEIGECAFEGTHISSLILPAKLLNIRKNAFKDCSNLKKLALPDSLEIVEEGAFETKSELVILASPETLKRISGQKGYIEYSQKNVALQCKANEFIERYKDYFDGKQTNNVPEIYDLIMHWIENGQNPKIYKKLVALLKVTMIDGRFFVRLIKRAQFLELDSEAEEFNRIYKEKARKLCESNRPHDWLWAYRLNYDHDIPFYKITEYFLLKCTSDIPKQFLHYVNSFMGAYALATKYSIIYKQEDFSENSFKTLDNLYVKKVGNRSYEEIEKLLHERITGTERCVKQLSNLERDLIEECEKACKENSPHAYLWRELAIAFSPSYKPPKCTPKPKVEKVKPQKTYISQNYSDLEMLTNDIVYTYTHTPSFTYTDEERRRGDEIIKEYELQKDVETYVGYLLDDIPTPSNIDDLIDKFSGIDWSEYGDV